MKNNDLAVSETAMPCYPRREAAKRPLPLAKKCYQVWRALEAVSSPSHKM